MGWALVCSQRLQMQFEFTLFRICSSRPCTMTDCCVFRWRCPCLDLSCAMARPSSTSSCPSPSSSSKTRTCLWELLAAWCLPDPSRPSWAAAGRWEPVHQEITAFKSLPACYWHTSLINHVLPVSLPRWTWRDFISLISPTTHLEYPAAPTGELTGFSEFLHGSDFLFFG